MCIIITITIMTFIANAKVWFGITFYFQFSQLLIPNFEIGNKMETG